MRTSGRRTCGRSTCATPEAVAALAASLPALDVLVNCAGIIARGRELDPAVFAEVVDVNLNGAMRMCAAARPLLARAPGGAIVNLASMLSFFGGGLVPGYSASKGGIAQLTKSLAIAYAPDRIRVNAVAPGLDPHAADRRAPGRPRPIGRRSSPARRWTAGASRRRSRGPVLFLASPAASFVTGAILTIDGGYSIA